jgi:hypothetical protein
MVEHDGPWFSAYASSFTSLREFASDQISAQTLSVLLKHFSSLEKLQYFGYYVPFTRKVHPTDLHLKILSEQLLLNLQSLKLHAGYFSRKVLADFINSCSTLPCSMIAPV